MLHRIIPALSLLALAGCQPYYNYPQYSGANPYANPYANRPPLPASGAYAYRPPATAVAMAGSTVPARAPGLSGIAILPASLLGGSFHEIDPHTGEVSFWNDDPVRRRDVANYPGRYVERLTLRNGGLFVYEALSAGDFAGPSDGDQLKADLDLAGFRERGIGFDATKLAQTGPFTYLVQSSASDSCFLFRARFRHPGTQLNQKAYGNLCVSKAAGDPAAVKAEMLYLLSHVRFANGASDNLLTAAATAAPPAAAAVAAAPPLALAAAGAPVTMSLDQCGYDVRFSSMPALGETAGAEYSYENGRYSERASCSCRQDLDYSKVSEFDAVDNTRARVEKKGFKFEKGTFDDTPGLGKELAYEAGVERDATEIFLVGRNFYRQCSFSVEATGASYGDLLKARKFVESVTARPVEAAPSPSAQVSDAVIGTAARASAMAGSTSAPAAAPRIAVNKSELSSAAEKVPGDRPVTPVAATGPADASAATEPAGSDGTATRLRRLRTLLDQKLITPVEYDAKRKAILDNL
jgi:hypothetical protein